MNSLSSTCKKYCTAHSPTFPSLHLRFAGSIPGGVDGFFLERKNPESDFLRKESKAIGPVLDLWHVKKPQAEIRASEQNLSEFSRSMSEATLMT